MRKCMARRACTSRAHARRVRSPCVFSSANCAASFASARRRPGPQHAGTLLACSCPVRSASTVALQFLLSTAIHDPVYLLGRASTRVREEVLHALSRYSLNRPTCPAVRRMAAPQACRMTAKRPAGYLILGETKGGAPAMQPGRRPSPMDSEMSYSAQMSRISSQCVNAKFSVWSRRHSCAPSLSTSAHAWPAARAAQRRGCGSKLAHWLAWYAQQPGGAGRHTA